MNHETVLLALTVAALAVQVFLLARMLHQSAAPPAAPHRPGSIAVEPWPVGRPGDPQPARASRVACPSCGKQHRPGSKAHCRRTA